MRTNRMHNRNPWDLATAVAVALGVVSSAAAAPQTVSLTCRFDNPKLALSSDGYAVVAIDGCETRTIAGSPRLPFRTVRLLLPPGTTVAGVATIPESAPVVLGGAWRLKPAGRPLRLDRQKAPDDLAVNPKQANRKPTRSIHGDRAELASSQRMAGYDIAVLRIFPLEYATDSERLVFTPAVRVEVTVSNRAGKASSNVPRAGSSAGSRARARAASMVDNPEALIAYDSTAAMPAASSKTILKDSPTYNYLLVTRQSLLSAFQPLVDRKVADGLLVRTETMENITNNYTGRDLAEKLRNYIRYAYTNWGIEYVLLGGDAGTVPCRGAYGYCGGADYSIPCDLYFACLDGSWNRDNDSFWGEPTDGDSGGDVDMLAEVYVGRAPVDTPEETAIFVSKVVAYETIGATAPFQAVNAGECLDDTGAQGGDALDKLLPALSNGSFRVQWLDDRPDVTARWTTTDCLTALNKSPHLVLHQGHADEATVMRIEVSDLDALTNHTPFLFYSAGCDAGAFDNDFSADCIGEELLKRSTNCAFAAILNSRAGWYDAQQEWRYSGEFQQAFLDQLLSQGHTTPGKAHQLAKQAMLGAVETSGDMPYRWCYFDLVLFGDPHTPLFIPVVTHLDRQSAAGAGVFTLHWNSLSNRLYSVYRATDLISPGFVCLNSNIVATPPLNTYTDMVTGVTQTFYRVSVIGQ